MKNPLKIVNPILGLLLLVQIFTVLSMKFFPIQEIGEIHEYVGLALVVVILIHLTLNFGWIKANFFGKKK